MMAQINLNGLDESKIWLHARRIDDKLVIVDQNGRILGGVTNASIYIGTDDLTKIEISLNSASRKGDGEISMDFRG